jgi:hypothetical protein
MYPHFVPRKLLQLISSGVLDLSKLEIFSFKLDEIDQAIAKAATLKGLQYCILVPDAAAKQ